MVSEDSTHEAADHAATVPASLVLVISAGAAVTSASLPATGVVSIGRSRDCTIAIEHDSLSRQHATLKLPELTVVDGSRNGTWVGGARIDTGVETPVPIGKPIRFGQVTAVVVRVGALDHGVLRAIDAQIGKARREGGTLALLRGRGVPPAGVKVVMQSDELWLATAREAPGGGDFEVAVFPRDGYDAAELFLAAGRVKRDEMIDKIAAGTVSVLVEGETGVGKERAAEAIHKRSPRAGAPLVKINCAAVAASLFESQMFGHTKGAFTGAIEDRAGVFEEADGGTLFLDEVAELPLELQAKLLRVLEDRVVVRVGETRGRALEVRFVCASNEQLQARVADGRFRSDLYFRLAGVTIRVPALRERRDEIRPLAELFVLRAAEVAQREPPVLGAAALGILEGHAWPGNIRQLRNVIERAVLLCDGPTLLPAHLLLDDAAPPQRSFDADKADDLLAALAQCAGNQTRAARLLGISRNTLLARLDRFGLPRPRK
jgi:two-component system, NtrC family, response regulator AtoC